MAEVLTLILDYPRDNSFAFDIEYKGKRYLDYAYTAEGCKFAHDVKGTAERFGGFRWINLRKAFVTAFETTGNELPNVIRAFERQGYTVRLCGAVADCLPMKNAA